MLVNKKLAKAQIFIALVALLTIPTAKYGFKMYYFTS